MIKTPLTIALVSFFIVQCSLSEHESASYALVWHDEFNTNYLDTTKWTQQVGTGAQFGLTGWGNNELQYYTDNTENLSFDGEHLMIEARQENHEGMEYTSAKLITQGLQSWTYGKVEIRAKLPESQGIWPALWMMPSSSKYGGWPESGEIDIMELLGHQADTVYGNAHFGNTFSDKGQHIQSLTLQDGSNFSDDFHVYGLEWKTDTLKWFVDGNHFHTLTHTDVEPYQWPFDQDFYLIMNIAVGGNWPGNPDKTTKLPQKMTIDYVRVYQKEN